MNCFGKKQTNKTLSLTKSQKLKANEKRKKESDDVHECIEITYTRNYSPPNPNHTDNGPHDLTIGYHSCAFQRKMSVK